MAKTKSQVEENQDLTSQDASLDNQEQGLEIQDPNAAIGDGFEEVEIVEPVDTTESMTILGNVIPFHEKHGLIHAVKNAASDAGRLEKLAFELGYVAKTGDGKKKLVKTVRGTGNSFVDITALRKMAKDGKIAGKSEKVKARLDAIQGMNLILDGLCLMGLAERHEEY